MNSLHRATRPFSEDDLEQIHSASMRILNETGIVMDSETVLTVFKHHGFKVESSRVFFTEKQVMRATRSAPKSFKIRARNPEKNLLLGTGTPVLCGTGGGIYIVEKDKTQRRGTMADYQKIAQLVQTSPLVQMTAHESVHPHDTDADTCHLDMLWQDLTLCDVAATSNTQNVHTVKDSLALLAIVFGGMEKLREKPSTIGIISPLSPLQYAPEQAEALVLLAEQRQPAAITNMLLLGSSAPVSIPGALALANAELLAGIVLSQLISPGTPVIYGNTSAPLYMKSGASCLGAPETLIISRGVAQLAAFYGVPCRTGGALSDAQMADGQAMAEGALCLNTAIESGVDYILHAFGMMGSFMATSLEKWVMDEEVCRYIFASMQKIEVSEKTLETQTLLDMGSKGNYLTHPATFQNFRSLFQHTLGNRDSHEIWIKKGGMDAIDQAEALVNSRLNAYEKPPMDLGMEQELKTYIQQRKLKLSSK